MEQQNIKYTRQQLGHYFQSRREQMGRSRHDLALHLGLTASTIKGIETGRFAWDIDLHLRLCQALEIMPFFVATNPPNGHRQAISSDNGLVYLQEGRNTFI